MTKSVYLKLAAFLILIFAADLVASQTYIALKMHPDILTLSVDETKSVTIIPTTARAKN